MGYRTNFNRFLKWYVFVKSIAIAIPAIVDLSEKILLFSFQELLVMINDYTKHLKEFPFFKQRFVIKSTQDAIQNLYNIYNLSVLCELRRYFLFTKKATAISRRELTTSTLYQSVRRRRMHKIFWKINDRLVDEIWIRGTKTKGCPVGCLWSRTTYTFSFSRSSLI